MDIAVREATVHDFARLLVIAAEGDFEQGDQADLAFIVEHGRLLCATVGDDVVGFGGTIPIRDVAMVTDLFVATSARANGVGSRLLNRLLDGWPRRMTFSSQHPAALAAYRRMGMRPGGRMLYLSGSAVGGGVELKPAVWAHDRRQLVDYFAEHGATVTADVVVRNGDVLRLDSADPVGACDAVLGAFDAGAQVSIYVPESHVLADWLRARGFTDIDHDIFCATDGVELAATLAALHPSFC